MVIRGQARRHSGSSFTVSEAFPACEHAIQPVMIIIAIVQAGWSSNLQPLSDLQVDSKNVQNIPDPIVGENSANTIYAHQPPKKLNFPPISPTYAMLWSG